LAQKPAAKFGFGVEPPAPGKGRKVRIRRVLLLPVPRCEGRLAEPTAVVGILLRYKKGGARFPCSAEL
jgi:hypothetical protein